MYIYTLNIDDGIERNSAYRFIIHANRSVDNSIFDDEQCVIKLHGDINDMLTYHDSCAEILTQEQYISSLKKNASLLDKLRHDIVFQNILYIGCSLNDEIDLLKISTEEDNPIKTNRYICLTKEPGLLDKHRYAKFGITHILLFDTYDKIYEEIHAAWIESQKVRLNDLESFNINHVHSNTLSPTYEANRSYLFYGKSLVNSNRSITLPYFFIQRTKTEAILSNISKYTIQIVLGNGCSGRTYSLFDIA